MQVEALADAASARAYYDARYAGGYMDRWETERRDRLRCVLRTVVLPERPRILDYGCGSGALTSLLAACWPGATVVGVDVSATAIAHAQARHPGADLRFALLDDAFLRDHAGQFDFVFSHHVLEHVFDLEATVRDLVGLLTAKGRMLHALPCGNPGSFAHWLCTQRPDGIDAAAGNRFFFEEASHLRRLRSDELAQHFARHGCHLAQAHFGYHWLGAVRLFTEMAPRDLLATLDPRPWPVARRLVWLPLAAVLLALCLLRAPVQVLVRARRLWHQAVVLRTRNLARLPSLCLLALVPPAMCLLPVSWLAEVAMRRADRREWRRRSGDPAGSEMMLQWTRAAADAAPPCRPARDFAGCGEPAAAAR